MEDEYYNVEVEFTAQETETNMQKGNLFLSAKFSSFKVKEQPLSYHRMSHMEFKSSFIIWVKEMLRYIPLLGYICNCEPKQSIIVPIVENFNNAEYSANGIEITLSNSSIVFTNAVLKIRTSLFGFRYLMRHWFFTTAFVAISFMTSAIFLTCLSFFIVIKSNIKGLLYKLYP